MPPTIELPTESDPVKVICGDCMGTLRELPDGCVDAVVTDPPYGIQFQSSRRIETERFDMIANDEVPYTPWLKDAGRVLKLGGCLVCFCRWDTAEVFRREISLVGMEVASQLIWDRVSHGMGDLEGCPAPQHDIIWFAKKGDYVLPGKRPMSVYREMRLIGTALRHPNEKPVRLMRRLVADFVEEGGLVLDPFAGSGTTGIAALMENRRCLLIEKDPKYVELINKRIAKFKRDEAETFLPRSAFRTKSKPEYLPEVGDDDMWKCKGDKK